MSKPAPRVLGIIPAKGGSSRLPRKNILPLGGRPLIDWAATAARDSRVVDRLVLSTEDAEVAEVARALDIEVPFLRPADLARDPAGIVDVCLHMVDELTKLGDSFDELVVLPPTTPLRSAEDIRQAHALFRARDAKFLMSVSPYDHTPFAALLMSDDGILTPAFPEYSGRKSQQMPAVYRPNGALHILDIPAFRAARSYYAQPLLAYPMPRERSIDIDHQEDLDLAAEILRRRTL